MIEVRILPLARERLLEIWDYTSKKWDDDQADSYVKA
jgi:plasmid stabilization system protein ParE